MATVQERLASSLEVLKEYQEKTGTCVIQGKETLGVTHTDRLLENGYLKQVLKGWYMLSMPGREGDTTLWYTSYWPFISAYCQARFGSEWSLTPEQSLTFHSGKREVPVQLMVRSPKASNNITPLLHGTGIFDIKASLPQHIHIDRETSVHMFPPAEALVAVPSAFYTAQPIRARTCLAAVSTDEIIKILSDNGYSVRAGRIAGALRNIGRSADADRILAVMKRLGYDVRESDPFEDEVRVSCIDSSPYAVRIQLMWEKMRQQILRLNLKLPYRTNLSLQEVKAGMEAKYVADAYHSLSIEGYRVTEKLIERVRHGKWNPAEDKEDGERKNALVARGYYQAFLKVKKSIADILRGKNSGDVFARDHEDWHFELFEPCVQAGIIKPSDLVGYRTEQVYIRGSRHTPVPTQAVRPAMKVLCDLLAGEEDGFVRAVLGHFFFVYIHPYMDGNGRTARFLMNTMLCSCGLEWTVIPTEKRNRYFDSLEKAGVEEDIVPFAKFLAGLF